jgi:hypothetical protein
MDWRDGRKALQDWMWGRDASEIRVIATRSVLRALPELARLQGPKYISTKRRSDIVLPCFRIANMAYLACRMPHILNDEKFLRYRANLERQLASEYVSRTDFSGYIFTSLTRVLGRDSAVELASGAASTVDFSIPNPKDGASIYYDAIENDIISLSGKIDSKEIALAKLWPTRAPRYFLDRWKVLRDALVGTNSGAAEDEQWSVWIDWYEGVIKGKPAFDDAIELARVLGPTEEEWKQPAKANAKLREVMDKLKRLDGTVKIRDEVETDIQKRDQWDYFISYSSSNESTARELVNVLESAGHTTFAQYKDFAPGSNFVREMQRGLDGAGRVITLHSPHYETSVLS